METRLPITQTTMRDKAFRGYEKSLAVKVLNSTDPIEQLKLTRVGVKVRVEKELRNLRRGGGVKFKETLVVTLRNLWCTCLVM